MLVRINMPDISVTVPKYYDNGKYWSHKDIEDKE